MPLKGVKSVATMAATNGLSEFPDDPSIDVKNIITLLRKRLFPGTWGHTREKWREF